MTHRTPWYALLTLTAAGGLTGRAPAQTPTDAGDDVRIAQMEVQLWPEYDDPRVLAIYAGELDADVDVPTPFRFVIPHGAQIHMAGGIGEGGRHLHALFETRPIGDSLIEVSYELESPSFYMEFYYDPFENGRKAFTYPLRSPYPIGSLRALVQQPLGAEDFRVTPPPLEVVQDAQGFNYHRLTFGPVAASETRSVAVSYVKPDRTPSVAAAGDGDESGSAMKSILIIGGLALLGAVGYGVYSSTSRSRANQGAALRREVGRATGPAPQSEGQPGPRRRKYCTLCGQELEMADRFCAACGAEARLLT